jgi:hypothetical protein
MFKFMHSPAYWWPVSLNVPAEDAPGKFNVVKFEVQFKREDTEQQQARLDESRAQGLSDAAYALGVVVGFRKLYAPDDTEVPFNADSLAALLKVPGAGTAIVLAHNDSTSQAAQKN